MQRPQEKKPRKRRKPLGPEDYDAAATGTSQKETVVDQDGPSAPVARLGSHRPHLPPLTFSTWTITTSPSFQRLGRLPA